MEEKQINKWLRRRFTTVGWALIGYYLILNILVLAAMATDILGQYLHAFAEGDFGFYPDEAAVTGNAWGYILASVVGFVILHAWKGPDFWRAEVLAKEQKMTAGTFGCLLCLCVGSQMANSLWVTLLEGILNAFGLSALGILDSVSGGAGTFSMFLYMGLLAPIGEEVIFRGYILRTLQPFGKRFAIFGSALLFGLYHGNLLQTPYAFLMGLVLGYVTVEHSIVWAAALHMFNNLVLADLLTRMTASLPELAVAGINLVIFGGCFLAAIGILIAKRREVREYNCGEWMDRRVVKCFFTNSGVIVLTGMMVISMIMMLFA